MNIGVSTLLQVHDLPWEDKWRHSSPQIEGEFIYTWKPIKLGDIFIPWLSNDSFISNNYSPILTGKKVLSVEIMASVPIHNKI